MIHTSFFPPLLLPLLDYGFVYSDQTKRTIITPFRAPQTHGGHKLFRFSSLLLGFTSFHHFFSSSPLALAASINPFSLLVGATTCTTGRFNILPPYGSHFSLPLLLLLILHSIGARFDTIRLARTSASFIPQNCCCINSCLPLVGTSKKMLKTQPHLTPHHSCTFPLHDHLRFPASGAAWVVLSITVFCVWRIVCCVCFFSYFFLHSHLR